MNISNDLLKVCPMTGGVMYEVEITPNIKMYMSITSGFWTNSLMLEGSDFYNEQTEILPEIYKKLAWIDPKTNLVWVPTFTNVENKGMSYVSFDENGWTWEAVKFIEVKEEEKEKYPDLKNPGKYLKYKTDITTKKQFGFDGFIKSLEYIGVDFNINNI
jgi:hypothetical protein